MENVRTQLSWEGRSDLKIARKVSHPPSSHGKPFSGGWGWEGGGGEGGGEVGRGGKIFPVRKIFPVFHHNITEFLKVFTSRFVPFPKTRIETVLLIAVVLSLLLL